MFAPISRLQRNKSGTNRRCINARRKSASASAKFKAQGGYLCIDKSTPREWRAEFGGKMVFARFLWQAEENAMKKRRELEGGTRKASGNREVVGTKVFASDGNFTNCVLMRHD